MGTAMHISQETAEQTRNRLLKVLAAAEFKVFEGTYAFEEFPASELSRRVRADALALVRDDELWSQLVASQDPAGEPVCLFRFHFAAGLDNSGFVGWLATHLKERLGTGVFVICGMNVNRGGIFDYWGCPARLGGEVKSAIESLIGLGRQAHPAVCP